jgi:hypothetical protein
MRRASRLANVADTEEGRLLMNNDSRVTENLLKDGSTLVFLKKRYLSKETKEQLDWVLSCMRDSILIVPTLPGSGKPDILERDDGARFLPVFSNMGEIPPDYADEFILKELRIQECLDLMHQADDCRGLALDGLTEPLVLESNLAESILTKPSRLMEE